MGTPKPKRKRNTRQDLVEAAIAEFETVGFEGTNTNRIARAAGYAPQTFYRHFDDKTAMFLTVYEQWYRDELAQLASARSRGEAARIIVERHRATLRFRRSLRQLAYSDRKVALARATSRNLQIDRLAATTAGRTRAELAANLLKIERLADAIAEGEFGDLQIGEDAALSELAQLLFWIEAD